MPSEEDGRAHDPATMALLVDSVRQVNERLERIDHMLRGNGRAGILTDVALIESRVKSLERLAREYGAMKRWLLVSMVTFAAGLAWNVIQWSMSQGAL